MLNLLKSSKPWMVASLLGATSIFAQESCKPVCEPCCEPHELLQCPTLPAYNAPARIDIQCGWDVWGEASFLYTSAIQENMEPAYEHNPGVTTTLGTNNFSFVNMNFGYAPGFNVGLGMSFDYDNWDTSLLYTWAYSTANRSAAMSQAAALTGAGYIPAWSNSINSTFSTIPSTAFKAHWRIDFDFIDADLGRWYYVGTQLTFRPSIGMRAAWIKQKRHATFTDILSPSLQWLDKEETHSWGVGTRFALDMNWMIGSGFRFFANSVLDVLFTRYHVNANSSNLVGTAIVLETDMYEKNINTLRPHVDLEWGLGWGTYLCNHNWHVDFSASYGFQVFWNQNMFRSSGSSPNLRYIMPNGDLYVHGLTATAKLDF
jgi:hypothetical protein